MTREDLRRPRPITSAVSPLVRRLFDLIEEDGRSFDKITKASGLAHPILSKWRHGGFSPKADSIEAIANVLGYTLRLEKK